MTVMITILILMNVAMLALIGFEMYRRIVQEKYRWLYVWFISDYYETYEIDMLDDIAYNLNMKFYVKDEPHEPMKIKLFLDNKIVDTAIVVVDSKGYIKRFEKPYRKEIEKLMKHLYNQNQRGKPSY